MTLDVDDLLLQNGSEDDSVIVAAFNETNNLAQVEQQLLLKLRAIIRRKGDLNMMGHYVAQIMLDDGSWWEFNDDKVESLTDNNPTELGGNNNDFISNDCVLVIYQIMNE